jgi:hypothetical protein
MPRYFFTLKSPDNEQADPEGIVLQNDGAALEYAQRIVGEFKEEDGYDDPDLLMIVTDASHAAWSRSRFRRDCSTEHMS